MDPDSQPAPESNSPPDRFPDEATCRVRELGFFNYMECCNPWFERCSYKINLGRGVLCTHHLRKSFAKVDQ